MTGVGTVPIRLTASGQAYSTMCRVYGINWVNDGLSAGTIILHNGTGITDPIVWKLSGIGAGTSGTQELPGILCSVGLYLEVAQVTEVVIYVA